MSDRLPPHRGALIKVQLVVRDNPEVLLRLASALHKGRRKVESFVFCPRHDATDRRVEVVLEGGQGVPQVVVQLGCLIDVVSIRTTQHDIEVAS